MTLQLFLSIVGITLSATGVSIAIYHLLAKFRKVYKWKEIHHMIHEVSKKLKDANVRPQLIVGTGRGGAIIGALMSYEFDAVPNLDFDRKYISENGKKRVEIFFKNFEISDEFKDIKSGPILLVTSKSDPGITLNIYKEFLESKGFSNIVKCALLKSKTSIDYDITYCYKEFGRSNEYKEFPWSFKKRDIMA